VTAPTSTQALIIEVGVQAADFLLHRTSRARVSLIVTEAVMHLLEQGLLVIPDDIEQRLEGPVRMGRRHGGD
jgi:hypothetical protein